MKVLFKAGGLEILLALLEILENYLKSQKVFGGGFPTCLSSGFRLQKKSRIKAALSNTEQQMSRETFHSAKQSNLLSWGPQFAYMVLNLVCQHLQQVIYGNIVARDKIVTLLDNEQDQMNYCTTIQGGCWGGEHRKRLVEQNGKWFTITNVEMKKRYISETHRYAEANKQIETGIAD